MLFRSVAHGFGVGLVPESALMLCRRKGVAAVPITDRGTSRPVYLVRRRDRSLSVASTALWEQLRKAAASRGVPRARHQAAAST